MRGLPDPTGAARVVAVWEGIRRTHGAPADQAAALMPPELLDVLEACPVTKTWATPGRPPEPDLAGARDKALLLVGFVGALCLSLVVNCIAAFNADLLGQAADRLRAAGFQVADADIAHLGPTMTEHLNVHGRYYFDLTPTPKALRPAPQLSTVDRT